MIHTVQMMLAHGSLAFGVKVVIAVDEICLWGHPDHLGLALGRRGGLLDRGASTEGDQEEQEEGVVYAHAVDRSRKEGKQS